MNVSLKRTPPAPQGHWLLGNLYHLQNDPLGLLIRNQKEFGDIIRFRFGPRNCYFLAHPDYIKHIFQTKAENYSKQTRGHNYLKLLLGEGLITSEGKLWQHQRQSAQMELRSEQVNHMIPNMVEAIQNTTQKLESMAEQNTTIDVHLEMARLALRVVDKTLFKIGFEDQEIDTIIYAMDFLDQSLSKRTRRILNLPLSIPSPDNLTFKKNLNNIKNIIRTIVKKYKCQKMQHKGLINQIFNDTTPVNCPFNGDQRIENEIITFLLSSHVSTSIALSWTWYLLSQHPEVRSHLHQEIALILKNSITSVEDLTLLTYTEQIIYESLRLYPPIWLTIRHAVHKDEIGGYDIPAGATVMLSRYITHRHPKFCEEPDLFNPERFSSDKRKNIHPFSFFPFGGGPRRCIGSHFAMMELKLAIAMLASRFKFASLPQHSVQVHPLISLTPRRSLKMSLSRS